MASQLEMFLQKLGIFTEESLVGYVIAFREQEEDPVSSCPGFPFLIDQEYVVLPGENKRLYPSNEVARDDTYIYYEDLGDNEQLFHFSQIVSELEARCRERGFA